MYSAICSYKGRNESAQARAATAPAEEDRDQPDREDEAGRGQVGVRSEPGEEEHGDPPALASQETGRGPILLVQGLQTSQYGVDEQDTREHDERVGAPEVRVEDVHRVQGQAHGGQARRRRTEEPSQERIGDQEHQNPRNDRRQPIARRPRAHEVEGEPLEERQHHVGAGLVEGRQDLAVARLAEIDGVGRRIGGGGDAVQEQGVVLVSVEERTPEPLDPQEDPQSECQRKQKQLEAVGARAHGAGRVTRGPLGSEAPEASPGAPGVCNGPVWACHRAPARDREGKIHVP